MDLECKTREAVVAALRSRGDSPSELQIERTPIKAGLEAQSVERVIARYRDHTGRCRRMSFVVKRLQGAAAREATVYAALLTSRLPGLLPTSYFIDRGQDDRALMLLEHVPRVCRWPWRDLVASRAVLQRLAALHAAHLVIPCTPEWEYEPELQQSAVATLDLLREMRSSAEWSSLAKRGIRPVDRIAASLARRRTALLEYRPLGPTTIHGDVHTGNVILRRVGGQDVPVLIDWGRARPGSALEDVSSWLQSLGYWESEARRRHDTLLRHYLCASGYEGSLSSDLRSAYWMAGACNALAGALRYHCWRAMNGTTVRARASEAHAAASWLRVIIRADALSA